MTLEDLDRTLQSGLHDAQISDRPSKSVEVSHPFARKKANGWGTELGGRIPMRTEEAGPSTPFAALRSLRMTIGIRHDNQYSPLRLLGEQADYVVDDDQVLGWGDYANYDRRVFRGD